MTKKHPPIIQISELLQLHQSKKLVIFDVSNGKNAKQNYEEKHLEGAIFVDLNSQLADFNKDVSNGGRHPFPKLEFFLETVANLGISDKSHVILYDDKNGSNAAARFWWMLKSIGHQNVQVLNGGIQEAEKNHFPLSSKMELTSKAEPYKVDNWRLNIATIDEVEQASKSKNHLVIDVRDADRFYGKTEPIDLIAGHIPGAINVPFAENLDENGLFLEPNLLKKKYEKLFGTIETENIIVHCGSGVTACHSLLAMDYAGLKVPKLYVGSWSEWSSNDKPIAKCKEN